MNGEVNVIVANSSFGMAIDKPNVRYATHANCPLVLKSTFNSVYIAVIQTKYFPQAFYWSGQHNR